jgi:hypothetical protein
LTKTKAANMTAGTARRAAVADLNALARSLEALTPAQAVGWGVTAADRVTLTTAVREEPGIDAPARARRNFSFFKGPGILMLDHDGTHDGALDRDTLRQRLIDACPSLATAPMLRRPSASAGLSAPDGRQLTALHRQALARCLVDASVWQPERLDFAAGSILQNGIQRSVERAHVFGDAAALFDLSTIVTTPADDKFASERKRKSRDAPADDEPETRKRLFAALREGARVLIWDNVREPLVCAALDAFLTAGTFSDRILGLSATASLPNRAQFIATGNNLRLTGDTCRRVFLARLDAKSEKPYARDFDRDPAQQIATARMQYVVAALTIIRAFIVTGRPMMGSGRTASFERWDDLVRQPICWLRTQMAEADGDDLPALDDPLQAAQIAFDQDPEMTTHTALLHAWHAAFPAIAATVASAVARGMPGDDLDCQARRTDD